jgi:DDE superfamily endonuclease
MTILYRDPKAARASRLRCLKAAIHVNQAVATALVNGLVCTPTEEEKPLPPRTRRSKLVRRRRQSVSTLHSKMSDAQFRRMYRMTRQSFYKLLELLKPHMQISRKGKFQRAPNGLIPDDVRLSAALRYFAGGKAYDIMTMHGIGHSSFFERCVWIVVDAVHRCKDLEIKYPESHDEQLKVARGFQEKSEAGFDCCGGAIDGMLVWTEEPRSKDCEEAKIGATKFFCGRKHKNGWNMQAVCDADGKFLEVWITFPASSSDYAAFFGSDFYTRLMRDGFLEGTLALFGDNAYVSTEKILSPFKGAPRGPRDDFNYFHSQLRIHIECAFGKLIHRWSILRSPLSATMGIKRQLALVLALCKLHNFCVSCNDECAPRRTRSDALYGLCRGAIDFDENQRPVELLGGGNHFDDVPLLPRAVSEKRMRLLELVKQHNVHRPELSNPYKAK